jgi:cell division protein FtsZ
MSETPFLPCPHTLPGANIKVVGVGGAGCNAINRMIESGVTGVQFIAMNTDQQCLANSRAHLKLSLGPQSSKGMGAGGNAERGAVAAEESREEVLAALQGADMIFITAGMGGGTGTGAAPLLASYARELGALTVAVVLTPFAYEGHKKAGLALRGLTNLRETADTVIVVSNERIKNVCESKVTFKEALRVADGVLIQGVRGIADLILKPGILNGDFADVETVLRNGGEALIGTGQGRGEEAVMDALKKALACPLLERAQSGAAAKVMVSITADWEVIENSSVETAMNFLQDHYAAHCDLKVCTVEGEGMEDRVMVTVLASGFDQEEQLEAKRRSSLHLEEAAPSAPPMQAYSTVLPAMSQPLPANVVSARVYGEALAHEQGPTPTRLMPQPPTPSGELPGADDLHVPAIMRMRQGQLPIE